MYIYGEGTEKDLDSAIQWYKEAANQNNNTAIYNLGEIYYHGQGVEQGYRKAFGYFKIAVEQGFSQAQLRLGYCYLLGHGCDKDEQRGLKLIEENPGGDTILIGLGGSYHTASPNTGFFLYHWNITYKYPIVTKQDTLSEVSTCFINMVMALSMTIKKL